MARRISGAEGPLQAQGAALGRAFNWRFSIALAGLVGSLLSGCGGSSSGSNAPPVAPTGLSGTVAVGAPLTDGKLRIIDSTGATVASDIAINADGSYANVPLTGTGPWRLEACGYAGGNYRCIYSVAQAAGTANVTPLTNASVLLAAGAAPETLMSGAAPALTADALANAQGVLRTSLAGVMQSAGVDSGFDFIGGALAGGSRTGYDKLLDAVGVSTGQDGGAFVQITPRLGDGNLFLQSGAAPVGSVTVAAGAADLDLSGLDALFGRMTSAVAGADACGQSGAGMAAQLASNARLSLGGGSILTGPAAVGQGLCSFFAGVDGGAAMWGSQLLSPLLGRCDLTGASPVCQVSFVLQSPDGAVQSMTGNLGVVEEAGAWRFLGNIDAVDIQASARAQRDTRIDGDMPVVTYSRAFAFDIPALSGLQCARVSQQAVDGSLQPMALFKPYPGAQERLSLWMTDANGSSRSLDPAAGALRSADDTWLILPQGSDGDAVVRNFYRGGRTVTVSLFSDSACTAPFAVDGKSTYAVDMQGVPPLWAEMANQSWVDLTADASTALRNLSAPAQGSANYAAAWRFNAGPVGVDGATFCSDRAQCGEGGSGRIGSADFRPGATSVNLTLTNGPTALAVDSYKMLALYGRTGEGVGLQINFISCPATPSGQICQ